MKNIHAFTETNTTPPGYISINDEAGRLTVSVRTRGGQVPSVIEMDRDQLAAMHADVGAYLTATAPAAPVVVEEVKPAAPVADTKPAKAGK